MTMQVHGTSAAASVQQPTATAPGVNASTTSTLPAPSLDGNAAIDMLMELCSVMNDNAAKGSKAAVSVASAKRSAATQKKIDALKKAIEAQKKAEKAKSGGGFLGKILHNLGPVGLVGMCVGSVYLVAADVALHATGLMRNKADLADLGAAGAACAGVAGIAILAAEVCIKKFGPDEIQSSLDKMGTVKDDDVRMANSIAMILYEAEIAAAMAIASGGTTTPAMVACVGVGISTATQIASETGATEAVFGENAKYVTMGGSIAGAALSIGGAAAGGMAGADRAMTAASIGVKVVEGGMEVADGVQQIHAAGLQRDADRAQIDVKQQKQIIEAIERTIDALVEDLKDKQATSERTAKICQSMKGTATQTMLTAAMVKG